eukprot:3617776-Rhodomonas_salina.1
MAGDRGLCGGERPRGAGCEDRVRCVSAEAACVPAMWCMSGSTAALIHASGSNAHVWCSSMRGKLEDGADDDDVHGNTAHVSGDTADFSGRCRRLQVWIRNAQQPYS